MISKDDIEYIKKIESLSEEDRIDEFEKMLEEFIKEVISMAKKFLVAILMITFIFMLAKTLIIWLG